MIGAYDVGLYPLFHLGLKHYFLRHYDFFSFINFPNGSIFGKRDLLAIDHIMLALFWSYVPKTK